jgi:hypothetical protein
VESLEDLSWGHGRVLARSAVAVLAVVWLVPVLDSFAAAWPFEPASLQWRYRTIAVLAPTMVTQMVALTGGAVLGAVLGWRWLVRVAATVALAVMVFSLLGVIIHSMDYVQLKASVPEDSRASFSLGMVRGTAQLLLGTVASACLAVGGLMAVRTALDGRKGTSRVVVVPGPSA